MRPISKNSLQVKFGEYFAEKFFASKDPISYKDIKEKAHKLKFVTPKIFGDVKRFYSVCLTWEGNEVKINTDGGYEFKDLLLEINVYRKRAGLDCLTEEGLAKSGERKQ